jgi:hypothetical protein
MWLGEGTEESDMAMEWFGSHETFLYRSLSREFSHPLSTMTVNTLSTLGLQFLF